MSFWLWEDRSPQCRQHGTLSCWAHGGFSVSREVGIKRREFFSDLQTRLLVVHSIFFQLPAETFASGRGWRRKGGGRRPRRGVAARMFIFSWKFCRSWRWLLQYGQEVKQHVHLLPPNLSPLATHHWLFAFLQGKNISSTKHKTNLRKTKDSCQRQGSFVFLKCRTLKPISKAISPPWEVAWAVVASWSKLNLFPQPIREKMLAPNKTKSSKNQNQKKQTQTEQHNQEAKRQKRAK